VTTVFEFLSNPRLEPKWNPWIQEVKLPVDSEVGEGTAFVAIYRFMGQEFKMNILIERYLPPRELTLKVIDGPFLGRTTYFLSPGSGNDTQVDVDFFLDPKDFFGIIPKALLAPIFRKSLRDDCRRQKALMENEAGDAV
jgi:hypothetical protein